MEGAVRVQSGCGPTNASLLLMYLSLSSPALRPLTPVNVKEKEGFVSLMNEVFEYVKPTLLGVYSTGLFSRGFAKYARKKGASLSLKTLDVPFFKALRPSGEQVTDFICEALKNAPVPFLNISNGGQKQLSSWHWVSIIEFDPKTGQAVIADQGRKKDINIREWLKASGFGGGFVGVQLFV